MTKRRSKRRALKVTVARKTEQITSFVLSGAALWQILKNAYPVKPDGVRKAEYHPVRTQIKQRLKGFGKFIKLHNITVMVSLTC